MLDFVCSLLQTAFYRLHEDVESCQYIPTSWDTPILKLVQPCARENIAHDYPAEKPPLNDGDREKIPLLKFGSSSSALVVKRLEAPIRNSNN